MPWLVTWRTLTPYTSLDGGFCTIWSFVAKGLFWTFMARIFTALVGLNDSRSFHWNRTCTIRETLPFERFHVTSSLSKIQTWRATKVFILIRHKRRYIYICLQFYSSIAFSLRCIGVPGEILRNILTNFWSLGERRGLKLGEVSYLVVFYNIKIFSPSTGWFSSYSFYCLTVKPISWFFIL